MIPLAIFFVLLRISLSSSLINSEYDNNNSQSYDVKAITGIVSWRQYIDHNQNLDVFNSIISFINSSSGIESVLLRRTDGGSVMRIDRNSFLWSRDCIIEIMSRNAYYGLICDGEVRMETIKIKSDYSIRNLFESTSWQSTMSDGSCSCIEI